MSHSSERPAPGGTPPSGERPAPTAPRSGPAPRSGLALRVSLVGWSLVLLLGAVLGAGLLTLWITSVTVVALGVGIPLTLLSTALVRWFADLHRRWAADRLGEPVARPYLPPPDGGWLVRLWAILRDPASWRDWAWLVANSITGWFTYGLSFVLFLGGVFYLIYPLLYELTPPQVFRTPLGNGFRLHSVQESFALVPLGPVLLLLWYATAERLANLDAWVIRSLLAPTAQAQLRARVAQLAASRAETVDTQAGELRRIERDLHDGAQARLVSLGMSLGLAQQLMLDDPHAARQLLEEARESTTSALAELRDLVRGIHPPVLADRGLDGALQALALLNPIPTTVVTRLPGRLPAPVESAAYFAVAEALSNAIKHAQAQHIRITVEFKPHPRATAGLLTMRVSDDGRGGAAIDAGTGLRGIARRLDAFDGTLTVDSPPGGPTEIRMSLPCASS
ncbi:signal transduction histidine kinase [Kitasatospora sp. MAP12-15]|uniref:sensor histidine kinase n=1 Tax=unclassified Kitasatospora TaxID=2633591 RepID=UPI002473F1A4|nr:sensor histidine kinase [Kitasatospora sp. MAP12-44]MDH6114634.1 signal transduction histidine kinase [Kitasatospora sp. MAP12-44]